jgi:hypothetical protein
MEGTTSATRHAATQILLRAKYLKISKELCADFCFDCELVAGAKRFVVETKIHSGAQPRADVFDKAIENGNEVFDNVMQAVQTLSFGSTRFCHGQEEIDDIKIANTLAQCANGTMNRSYRYGCAWTWKQEEKTIKPQSPRFSIFQITHLCGADTSV